MNFKLSQEKFKPQKEIQEIENLITAYQFAQTNPLTEKNLLKSHQILAKTLVIKSKQGRYRNEKVGVFGSSGLVYLAIEAELVQSAMTDLFDDLNVLLKADLPKSKVFYYASLIHLKFAHIHPFRDGNGRAARLLEKWFLAEKLGKEFWKLSSEKLYKEHQAEYYTNINLGVNYYELDYRKCIPFLLMLPTSLEIK
jgi:Fic family protein